MKWHLILFLFLTALFIAGTIIFKAIPQSLNIRNDIKEDIKSDIVEIGGAKFNVKIARTFKEQSRGLTGRENLAENQGMLFLFNALGRHGFWMKGMRFPIDIIWIANNSVIGVTENIPPDNSSNPIIYYPPANINAALEVPAGSITKYNITQGMEVMLR